MSQDKPVSRKQKKAQRDAERQKKGKKRKRDESEEQEHRVQDELQQDFISLNDGVEDVEATHKSSSQKHRGEDIQQDGEVDDASHTAVAHKRKKRPKVRHDTTEHGEGDDQAVASGKERKPRFILFIGNLPYATTDASLHAHFKKLAPFTLRHRTDPKTKKSKGFAFLEFENYDRMKTCLKLYHHSMFDPAKSNPEDEEEVEKDAKKRKGKGARRINVELTAGGGGKAEGRKEKIKAKNVRLDGQRKRRVEEEMKGREKERAKKKPSGGDTDEAAGKKPEAVSGDDDTAGMHPSRLARMKK